MAAAGDVRIQLPPAPASSWQTVHGLTSVFTGGATQRRARLSLLLALAVSLLLHLLVWSLWRPASGSALPPAGGRVALLVTLGEALRQPAPSATAESSPLSAPGLPEADTLSGVEHVPEAPEAAALLATLGERRLATHVPPYLAQAWVINAPPGSWYFRRAELTVPPEPLEEAVLPPELAADTGALRGTVVLRVFLGASGQVERVAVEHSTLAAAVEEPVVTVLARLRFRPGEIEGVPVSSETRLELSFDAAESGRSQATDRPGVFPSRPRDKAGPSAGAGAVDLAPARR